jgi:dihydrofolate reductase
VITSNKDWVSENVVTAFSLEDALEKATAAHYKEIFIIGGGEIYKQSLAMANRIYLTRVHTQIDGDTFFPELKEAEWKMVAATECKADEKNAFDHTIEIWERI